MPEATWKKRSRLIQIKESWRRFKKNKTAMIGLFVFMIFIFFVLFADVLADYQTKAVKQGQAPRLQAPSTEHIFGTDSLGRDIFARIVHGTRYSLSIGIISTLFAAVTGGILGALAAYYGRMTDNVIMRLLDVVTCLPALLLSLAIIAALGPSLLNLLIGISIASIPNYARLVRAVVMTIVGQDYIEAARACGTGDFRIITKHVMMNAMGPIIVQATVSISGMILFASGLSYLGLGVQPPTPEWGAMLSDAREYMRTAPHLIIIPGITIILAALSISLIGDGLRDALDPRLKD